MLYCPRKIREGFGMNQGAWEPQAAQAAVFSKGWPPRKATLYVYAEAEPSPGPWLLTGVVEAVGEGWRRSRLSTTASLLGAAQQGLKALARGASSLQYAGLACAQIKKGQLYLVQGGASTIYLLGSQEWRKLAAPHPHDPWDLRLYQEALPSEGLLLFCSPGFEEASHLHRGGLPLSEVRRLLEVWLGVNPEARALLIDLEGGRQQAHILAGTLPSGSPPSPTPAPEPPPQERVARRAPPPYNTAGQGRGEAPFPILRALRFPLLIIAALLALLILGGLGWYLPSYQKKQDEKRLVLLLEEARGVQQEALALRDVSLSRQRLEEALRLLAEARSIREKDRRVITLQQEIRQDLDRVNSTQRLSRVEALVDLAELGGDKSNPSRLVVDGNNIYVLDRAAGRVYKFLLDRSGQSLLLSSNNVLLRKGDVFDNVSLGEPVEILWMPPGGLRPQGSLLILDDKGILLEYRPEQGLRLLPLRGAENWVSFRRARGYRGNLYILDATADQVWRYIPTAYGYDSEAHGVLGETDIEDAVDFAVDGYIYVLTASGQIWKFGGGEPLALSQEGIDQPLARPVAIFTNRATKYIYVADRGNNRIVVFDKEGGFHHQLRARALSDPQAVFVVEGAGRLYFTSDGKLYGATLPPSAP
jgi:hypothetical protein